jgi:hypothetical protein
MCVALLETGRGGHGRTEWNSVLRGFDRSRRRNIDYNVPRTLPESIAPLSLWLVGALAVLFVLLQIARPRWSWRRALVAARSEEGGVQSVSFILTIPFFIMLVMFIVQISQLMTGLMVVHYAAFAAARSAQVWIPASASWQGNGVPANQFPQSVDVGQTIVIDGSQMLGGLDLKREKIFTAAVLACAPIAPSKNVGPGNGGLMLSETNAVQKAYGLLDPTSAANPLIPARLANKIQYSAANTFVTLTITDRSSGPPQNYQTYNPQGHPQVPYRPYEVGWQDPVTVTVLHDFRMLPGPGRFLSRYLVPNDPVAPLIRRTGDVYQVRLAASTTMTIEGLKPAN